MNPVGPYLRELRTELSLSLNDVCKKTGITTTRLNRIELGQINEPSPEVLKKLSAFYHINLLELYKMAGYLEDTNFPEQTIPFFNYETLSCEERNFIQQSIDFLVKKHYTTNEGVHHEI